MILLMIPELYSKSHETDLCFYKKWFQCSYEEAAILISVPHSTIMDIIGIVYSKSVPVAKESVTNIPIIGVIGRFLQVSLTLFCLCDLT